MDQDKRSTDSEARGALEEFPIVKTEERRIKSEIDQSFLLMLMMMIIMII